MNDELQMPEALTLLMRNAGPVTRRKALTKARQYLMRSNKKRIRANVTPDGSRMAARKKGNASMFRKLGKYLMYRSHAERSEIGFWGREGWIAANHQYGNTVRYRYFDVQLLVRELLGISEKDAEAVKGILLEHILQGVQTR